MKTKLFTLCTLLSMLIALTLLAPAVAPRVAAATASTWAKTYGGSGNDATNSIIATSDGGYIVAGYTSSFGAGNTDAWVLKVDGSGDVVWQKTYGGSGYEDATSIAPASDGGYIVAGDTSSFGAGQFDAWVLKLDANGSVGNSCSLIGSSSATVANSTAIVANSPATGTNTTVTPGVSNATVTNSSAQVATQCQGTVALTVPIDIKPGSSTNPINLTSNGVIPVAILSTATFDAATVVASSVKFGPNGATSTQSSLEDVNGDGRLDLVLHFLTQQTGIKAGDTQACLTGQTTSGVSIQGCDSIRTRS